MAGVYVLNVQHDDWCALIKKSGECNCNPDVKLEAFQTQKENKK